VKRGHLSGARFARRLLKPYALTPARFDLMNAIGSRGARQCDLWRRLNVVRSVISEMLASLLELAWVKRVRAADGRTWLVMWTRRGREIYERANSECVSSGHVGVHVDAVLVDRDYERDPEPKRITLIYALGKFVEEFGWWLATGNSLYLFDPEEYYHLFADTELPWVGKVPFVT
jgi:DNA-binding MarR family transcriptional regulator